MLVANVKIGDALANIRATAGLGFKVR